MRIFDRRTAPGLPQSTIRSLLQDEEGALQMGTMDGLASFEGNEVQEVEPSGQPPFGRVTAMARRRAGGFYVADTTGIRLFDGVRWRPFRAGLAVDALAEDTLGRLWYVDALGTLGFTEDQGRSWKTVEPARIPGLAVAVATPRDGRVWVAGQRGVALYERGAWRSVAQPPLDTEPITAMMAPREGGPWVGTRAGTIWRLMNATEGATGSWVPGAAGALPPEPVTCLEEDLWGRVWAGTQRGSIFTAQLDGRWRVWGIEAGLRTSAGINRILADREGTIWFAQNGVGARQVLSEHWTHRTQWVWGQTTIPSGGVYGIAPTADGGVAVAVYSRGLWCWDGHRMKQYGFEEGLTENILAVAEPEPGRLWAGGRFGLWEARKGGRFQRTLTLPTGFITGLFKDPQGHWLASSSTAGIFIQEDGRWVPDARLNADLPSPFVRQVAWTSDGRTWVATMGGVLVVKGGSRERLTLATHPALPVPANCVLQVGPDEVWVGGSGGIGILKEGTWRHLGLADGLPGRTIYAMALGEKGSVWVGGSGGVGHFAEGHWTNYDARTGLLEEECNQGGLLVRPGGEVLVGTMGGLAQFRPGLPGVVPPPLHCLWRDRPAPDAKGMAHLPASVRSLVLRWSAPSTLPLKVEYRTRIRRLSEAWSAPTQRSALDLVLLRPGTWTVEVQARREGSGEGGWTRPIETSFTVEPTFLESWAARILMVLAAAGLLLAAFRIRVRLLVKREEELQEALSEAQSSVKTLRGLIPICAWCKKIRDDEGAWNQLEAYVTQNSEAAFSHGVCPDCRQRLVEEKAPPASS